MKFQPRLWKKKDEIASLISYRREIVRLAKVAGPTVFEKTVEELKENFTANKQSKIEAFAVEHFEDNHVEHGLIKPSGVMLTLEKMGFLVPMKVFDQDALGTLDSAAIAAEN